MANIGNIVHTAQGLGLVVKILPGRTDPDLSKVIAEPLDTNNGEDLTFETFGTPLPGQSSTAANFVQTLLLPADNDTQDSQTPDTTAATVAVPTDTTATDTTATDTASADSGTNASAATVPPQGPASDAQIQQDQLLGQQQVSAYSQAANAYTAAMQRAVTENPRTLTIG
jgi:hypothetical protein